ncbi:MAG: glycosyltransferase family 1 protein [Desulfovibrionaceae bacterium]
MRTGIFIPPLPRLTGGMTVLMRVAEHLHAQGQKVFLVLREASPALHAALPPHIPCVLWNTFSLCAEDCWLTPEGWPHALLLGLQAKARCVIYVQNWAYFLSNLPENTFWDQLALRCIAVSDPVSHFIHYASGLDAPVLRPAVDPALFHPSASLDPTGGAAPLQGPIRIAYMPRKNSALARQIRECFSARQHHSTRFLPPLNVEWHEIHHKSPCEVAEILRNSHIFLATGFPEGCPLPPLEALASGCIVVGFAGLGGWDYMRQVTLPRPDTWDFPLAPASAYTAPLPLRPVPWSGNGLYVADADVLGAAHALEEACQLLRCGGLALHALRQAAAQTAAAYSPQQQAASIAELWHHWI